MKAGGDDQTRGQSVCAECTWQARRKSWEAVSLLVIKPAPAAHLRHSLRPTQLEVNDNGISICYYERFHG